MEGRNFDGSNLLGEQNIEFPKPHLVEELDSTEGREIEGLESKPERFSRLEEGRDYKLVQKNHAVESARPYSEFMLFLNPTNGTETRMVSAPHWRTVAEDMRTFVKLEDGQTREPYYTVSTKGVGYLKPTLKGRSIDEATTWTLHDKVEDDFDSKILGLSSELEYTKVHILERSKLLVNAGLRSEVYWTMAQLKNVYYHGELTSINDLRNKDVILRRRDYKPFMSVRLLKMNERIEEVRYAPERRSDIFEKAFEVFNQESEDKGLPFPKLDKRNSEHQKTFFKEFCKRMGANIAILLNTGFSHFRLHSSNITLAAEIVDIGSLRDMKIEKDPVFVKDYNGVFRGNLKDMRDVARALKKFRMAAKLAGLKFGDSESLKKSVIQGFDEKFDVEAVESQGVNATNARKWFDAILQAILVDGKKLQGLLDADELNVVEDQWGISIE